jgi:hypothetical protein
MRTGIERKAWKGISFSVEMMMLMMMNHPHEKYSETMEWKWSKQGDRRVR